MSSTPSPGFGRTVPLNRDDALKSQSGVVLIIAMILLVVISLLAVTSMRNAASSEAVSGSVRMVELATQAADIALRHCESSTIKVEKVRSGDTTSAEAIYANYGFVEANVLRATTAVQWQSTATWDSTSTATYVLPSSLLGGTATFKRPPECMVESLTGTAPSTAGVDSAAFLITARGFGPEVSVADASRTAAVGTVVRLQSTIQNP